MPKKILRFYNTPTKRLDELEILLKSTSIVLENLPLKQKAQEIFNLCKELSGATSGYVALLSDDGQQNTVLFLDTGENLCTLNPELPMPIRGLREIAYQSGKTVFDNNYNDNFFSKFLPEGHIPIMNILFSPLMVKGQVMGLLGLANKKDGFSAYDVSLIQDFSDLIALALDNNRKFNILHNKKEKFKAVIRRSGKRFGSIFNNAPVGMVLADLDSKFILVNTAFCEMLEYTMEELKNTTFLDKTHPEDLNISLNFIEEAKLGKKDKFSFEKRYISKTGKVIWANVAVSLLKDINGNLENYLIMVEDITQKVEAKKQLAKAKRKAAVDEKLAALGTMAAGIAHEINQPLNSLKVTVDSILYCYEKFGELDEKEIIEKLKLISQETDGVSQIINNVRSFVRKEKEIPVESCNLNKIINTVLVKMKKNIEDNKIFVQSSLKEIPDLMGNFAGLETMIVNILNNSIKAFQGTVKKHKEITINTFLKDNNIYLEISDNATGIDEKILDLAYDPFFTAGAVNEGMGLGLTIVHWVVRRHNGNIEITNNSLGGVTCEIQIPVV